MRSKDCWRRGKEEGKEERKEEGEEEGKEEGRKEEGGAQDKKVMTYRRACRQ